MKLLNSISFEQLMVFFIFIMLSVVIFLYGGDREILNFILGAFIGAFTNTFRNNSGENDK